MKKITPDLHHLNDDVPCDRDLSPIVFEQNYTQRYTHDAYDQACAITAWQQLYDQLSPGRFEGELTETLFDGLQVFHEYTNLSLRQSCMVWPNAFWFGIPGEQQNSGYIGNHILGQQRIAVRPGGQEFELSTPDDYHIQGLVISHDILKKHAVVLQNPERLMKMLSENQTLSIDAYKKEAIWQYIRHALCHSQIEQERHQTVSRVLSHNLLVAFLGVLEDASTVADEHCTNRVNYLKLVSKARDYLFENASEAVTVLELCNELYVSRRTLQNAFQQVLGIGPNAYLKTIRLNAVRRELVSPYSKQTTVKDAAMQWGFWHLGQFACDYQRLFNEKPSETLSRRLI
ncbi:HTH-type transcriptional regulator EutR [Yersinia enterocolitica]|uniref:HTH-type transcriptional regulator EutR n=1 Tax=Klebsiella sp. BIGb0407 TaxID=2940603 RepID=UPI002167B08D|nr:HTH-type transcriptional regulator EutR [Klebsiella sp. BIGb0407]MCS3433990.1 AraC family ethanolamine operon transcriptional activator [Klebsiella sp. BIGb0407]